MNNEKFKGKDIVQCAIGGTMASILVVILGATPWIPPLYGFIIAIIWLWLFYMGINQVGVKYPMQHILGAFGVSILVNTLLYMVFNLVTWEQLMANFFGSPVFIIATFLSFPTALVFDLNNLTNIFSKYNWWTKR